MKRRGFLQRLLGGVVAVGVKPSLALEPAPLPPPVVRSTLRWNPPLATATYPTGIAMSMEWLKPDEQRRDS